MRQQLEKIIDSYEPRINAREQIYVVGDLETLSSSVFYTGNPGGDFKPASSFGIGPGIARESEGFIERYRAGRHENYGKDHLNLEYFSPVSKKPLTNIHIDMKDN